jgi:hypothetical protein
MPFFFKEEHGGSKAYYLKVFWQKDKIALKNHFRLSFIVRTKLASQPFFSPRELPPSQKDLLFFSIYCVVTESNCFTKCFHLFHP